MGRPNLVQVLPVPRDKSAAPSLLLVNHHNILTKMIWKIIPGITGAEALIQEVFYSIATKSAEVVVPRRGDKLVL